MACSISRYIHPIPFSNIGNIACPNSPLKKGSSNPTSNYQLGYNFSPQKKTHQLPGCPIHCGRLDLHQMDPSNLKIRVAVKMAPDDGGSRTVDDWISKKKKSRYEIWKNHNGTNKTQWQRMIGGRIMRDGF